MNSLKAGDYKVCSKLLDEYFKDIASAGSSSIQYMYCLFYNFVSVAIKTCDDMHMNFKDIMQQETAQILDIGKYRNTMQMIDSVYSIYLTICSYIQKNKISCNSGLKMQIERYINNNYTNMGISMIELTEKLGYSSSYLCRFIKQQFGMGFGDLLNKTRLDAAKKLLSNTQYQIKEISTRAGYSSINSFIRTFKQIEGVTPGQYREICMENNITDTIKSMNS
jgi:AraC-like DNA-binding protein